MNSKLMRQLEIAGVPVIFTAAALLHGLYDLTNQSALGAFVGAVNESVWEHLKIFAIPYILWAIAELLWARPSFREFICAKVASLYLLLISITALFYTYTFFTKKPVLAVDIGGSIAFLAISQYLSFRLLYWDKNKGQHFYTAVCLLCLLMIMIVSFTFYPPKTGIFRDPITGGYGAPPKALDEGAEVMSQIYGEALGN